MAEKKKSLIVVRSTKNAEAFDQFTALAEKFKCSMSGLMSAAIAQFVANPPETVPELAKGNARATAAGFWLLVETDETGKPKKISIQEVKSRGDAEGKEFYRYTVKDGEVNKKSRDGALEKVTTAASELCTWTGLKFTKKDIKILS